jgi:hypothetical protein
MNEGDNVSVAHKILNTKYVIHDHYYHSTYLDGIESLSKGEQYLVYMNDGTIELRVKD